MSFSQLLRGLQLCCRCLPTPAAVAAVALNSSTVFANAFEAKSTSGIVGVTVAVSAGESVVFLTVVFVGKSGIVRAVVSEFFCSAGL